MYDYEKPRSIWEYLYLLCKVIFTGYQVIIGIFIFISVMSAGVLAFPCIVAGFFLTVFAIPFAIVSLCFSKMYKNVLDNRLDEMRKERARQRGFVV